MSQPYAATQGPVPRSGGDVVSGEAVVLELRLAKLPTRSLAALIDITCQVLLIVALTFLLGAAGSRLDPAAVGALALVGVVAALVGYPVFWESLTRGRSPGKLALGLRVVRDDGGPVRFRHSLVRALLGVVEIWLTTGTVAIVASLVSTRGKRLGDQLAGTVEVRERVPVQGAVLPQVPPWLSGWAAQADLGRVPDDLALTARQFLSRAPQLTPAVRDGMGRQLATAVARFVAPAPPPGTNAEAFLAAVLAERTRRATVTRATPGAPTGSWAGLPPATLPPAPPPAATPPAPPHDGFAPPG